MRDIQVRKEKVKLSQFADQMILSVENPMESIKRLYELISLIGYIVTFFQQ